jgi:hypothetical protein
LAASQDSPDEKRLWLFAFMILVLVSLWLLVLRLFNSAFLALDFEVTLVYFPTALAGVIALYLSLVKSPH